MRHEQTFTIHLRHPMQALEVRRNGQLMVVAGAPDALLISMHLSVQVNGADSATLHIGGMRDLGANRRSHVLWLDEVALASGDELRVQLASVDEATSPTEDVATDSQEYMAAQSRYQAELVLNPPKASRLERLRPDASLEVIVGRAVPIVAGFERDSELLSLGIVWNSWHPGRCRVSLSTCSCEQALARQGGKDWFKGRVGQEEPVVVRIGK